MKVLFDFNAQENEAVKKEVEVFLDDVKTLEGEQGVPIIIYQDGKSKGYYIKCDIDAVIAGPLLDMDAKLHPEDEESFRANRQLLLNHSTYKRMLTDTKEGREFNDIIIEYNKDYSPERPMKIWGGQHRVKAIQEAYQEAGASRYHGFKIFFRLSKYQRAEIVLISNTNISVSSDLFDRLQEETRVGFNLRRWCYKVGLLEEGEDFPDLGSRSEKITVKLTRTFITNFYRGKKKSKELKRKRVDLDKMFYTPYLCESVEGLDEEYEDLIKKHGGSIWNDKSLLGAGDAFTKLHNEQYTAVKNSDKIQNRKGFRNKAMTASVLSAWAYIAGFLQVFPERLQNHYKVPRTNSQIPDPLNAKEMSQYRHAKDARTYRGLGTRTAVKDRRRMAQLFLMRSLHGDTVIDRKRINDAVSNTIAFELLNSGFTS